MSNYNCKIITDYLDKIIGSEFEHNGKKHIFDFKYEIQFPRQDCKESEEILQDCKESEEILIEIDKDVSPSSHRIYWQLVHMGALDDLKEQFKKIDKRFYIVSGAYVNKEGKEYGQNGHYIHLLF